MSEIKVDDPKRGVKLKGADKTARIPIKSRPPSGKTEKARMDTRQTAVTQIL